MQAPEEAWHTPVHESEAQQEPPLQAPDRQNMPEEHAAPAGSRQLPKASQAVVQPLPARQHVPPTQAPEEQAAPEAHALPTPSACLPASQHAWVEASKLQPLEHVALTPLEEATRALPEVETLPPLLVRPANVQEEVAPPQGRPVVQAAARAWEVCPEGHCSQYRAPMVAE
jgi:hypothetical protein